MTTLERLIRTACEQRKQAIFLEKVPAYVPKKPTENDQRLFGTYRRLRRDVRKIEKRLDSRGWQYQGQGLTEAWQSRNKHTERLKVARMHRVGAIERLRQAATVQALGVDPHKGKPILTKLGRELAKV